MKEPEDRGSRIEDRGRTAHPRTSFPASRALGFTLLELCVVLFLLSLVAALVVPSLPSAGSSSLKSSARNTAAMLRYLGERSVGSKTVYRLHVNLSANTMKITRRLASGEEAPPDDPYLTRQLLEDGVVIADLQNPRLGKVTEGEVLIDFGAGGLSEFLLLHLRSEKGAVMTVAGYPNNGKVKLFEGYEELTL